MPTVGQTALVLLAPEAQAALSRVALAYPRLVRSGLPAHVTVLHPWVPLDEVNQEVLALCAELATSLPTMAVNFKRVSIKPGFIYLDPDRADQIEALADAVQKSWPDLPPYGGKYNAART